MKGRTSLIVGIIAIIVSLVMVSGGGSVALGEGNGKNQYIKNADELVEVLSSIKQNGNIDILSLRNRLVALSSDSEDNISAKYDSFTLLTKSRVKADVNFGSKQPGFGEYEYAVSSESKVLLDKVMQMGITKDRIYLRSQGTMYGSVEQTEETIHKFSTNSNDVSITSSGSDFDVEFFVESENMYVRINKFKINSSSRKQDKLKNEVKKEDGKFFDLSRAYGVWYKFDTSSYSEYDSSAREVINYIYKVITDTNIKQISVLNDCIKANKEEGFKISDNIWEMKKDIAKRMYDDLSQVSLGAGASDYMDDGAVAFYIDFNDKTSPKMQLICSINGSETNMRSDVSEVNDITISNVGNTVISTKGLIAENGQKLIDIWSEIDE